MVIIGSNVQMIHEANEIVHQQFKLKDLGELKIFLGIQVLRSKTEVIPHQRKYIVELISTIGLTGAKPVSIHLEFNLRMTTLEFD